jgi:hypothetical protein
MHYHVGSNIPGYVSEGDLDTYSTKRDASRAVAEKARNYRDEEYDLPRSQRRVAHGTSKQGYVKFERPNDPYDLGLLFWWARCQEIDCLPEED